VVAHRTAAPQSGVAVDERAELRRRLSFLEMLIAAFEELRDVQSTVEMVARLATRELASACWIYLRDPQGRLRLACAAQSDPRKGQPEIPGDLHARVAKLDRSRTNEVPQAGGQAPCLLLSMEVEKDLLGAIGLIPRAPTEASSGSLAGILADQAAKALARARAHAAAQRAVRIRDEAFAAAAHELGNSLGALHLQVHAISHADVYEGADSRLRSRFYAMERQVARLIGLNHRMLATSWLTTSTFETELEPVDASELVREVLAREADHLAWRRCAVELIGADSVVGQWDRGLLDQIFSNLLSNAMKYGHGKPISIVVRPTPTRARFEIQDNGIGIAAEDQDRIFEKFERAAAIEKGSSLGLGLWLTREMVQALGGTVLVQSAIGAGSTFVVELPRGAPAPPGEGKPT
jgi:signal transduction histidine kinase